MTKFACYGKVVGGKYLGEVEAETAEEAEEKAWNLDSAHVSICHQCSRQIDDAQLDSIEVEERSHEKAG